MMSQYLEQRLISDVLPRLRSNTQRPLWSLRDLSVRKIEIVKSGKLLQSCGFSAVISTVTQEKSCLVALSHTTVNDTGVYTCVASNLIGSVNVTLGVTVKGEDWC